MYWQGMIIWIFGFFAMIYGPFELIIPFAVLEILGITMMWKDVGITMWKDVVPIGTDETIVKKDYVCTKCGEPVLRDAWVYWDTESQEWVLSEVFDQAFCSNCDGETKAETKIIK